MCKFFASFYGFFYSLNSLLVTVGTSGALLLGPSSVTIHNNSYVMRYTAHIYLTASLNHMDMYRCTSYRVEKYLRTTKVLVKINSCVPLLSRNRSGTREGLNKIGKRDTQVMVPVCTVLVSVGEVLSLRRFLQRCCLCSQRMFF